MANVPKTGIRYDLLAVHVVCFDLKISVREGFLNLKKYPSVSLFLFLKAFEWSNAITKQKHFYCFLKKCIIILSLHEFEHKNI
jgi:hypothetical protein